MQIDLNIPKNYLNVIHDFLYERFDPDIFKCFKTASTNHGVFDFYAKLSEICESRGDCEFFTIEEIIGFMYSNFESVLGYHASKQINPDVILVEGLKIIDYSTFVNLSIERFGKLAANEKILKSVACFRERIEEMVINFSGNEEFTGHHFLIYGSETLLSIANIIDNGNCRQLLRDSGIPVIYRCLVPIEEIVDEDLVCLFKILLFNYYVSLSGNPTNFELYCDFSIKGKELNKKYILNYFIPTYTMIDYHDYGEYHYDTINMMNVYRR